MKKPELDLVHMDFLPILNPPCFFKRSSILRRKKKGRGFLSEWMYRLDQQLRFFFHDVVSATIG